MIDLEQKKLGYKLKHGDLPSNFEKVMLTDRIRAPLKKQHHYNTRKKQLMNLPQHKSKTYNDSFLHLLHYWPTNQCRLERISFISFE